MDKKKLLKYLVFLMIVIFLANCTAWKFNWYYTIWWFDTVMHFLGRFWVSLFFIYVFQDRLPKNRQFLAVILSLLAMGVLWEVFEYYLNIISYEPFSWSDTLADVFFDLLGGITAFRYSFKRMYN